MFQKNYSDEAIKDDHINWKKKKKLNGWHNWLIDTFKAHYITYIMLIY
jgi:hypothetical protein